MTTPQHSNHEKVMIRRVVRAYLQFAAITAATSALAAGIRYVVGDPHWYQWGLGGFIMLLPTALCTWYIADEVTKP